MTEQEDPAEFYDALAPMFDVMTDWDQRLASEGPFLQALLAGAGVRRVLDAACGSGGHALALARWGYSVAGADVSAGMVRLAESRARAGDVDVPFRLVGLADLPGHFASAAFDAVLCLGNSLPHLLTQEDLLAGLQGMAAVLRPGGLLVLQNLNYDLRWRTQPRFFGAQGGNLADQEVLVWRFADYDLPATRIAFNIALFRKAASGWQVQVHTTLQRPMRQADLLAALEDAGFVDVTSYGAMVWPPAPFEIQSSGDLVVVAHKRASA